MSTISWLEKYLEDTTKIQTNESESIIKLLRVLFENSDIFENSLELDEHFNKITDLHSISILAHEIFYLANRHDQHNPSIYVYSICLRLLAFNCFNVILNEGSKHIKLVDSKMYWYTDHKKYLNELANGESIVIYSSVLTSLCLQLLNMGSNTNHFAAVKDFVKRHKNKKFAQDVYARCLFDDEQVS